MSKDFFWLAAMAIVAIGTVAFAQSTTTQVVSPGDTPGAAMVTTTVQTPITPGTTVVQTPTVTTKITSTPGHSVITRAKDGRKIEMDSDNSVYVVFPDGARTAAPDGILTLLDGANITVKDGKRIP